MGRSLRGRFSGVVRYTDELVRALVPLLGDGLSVFVTRSSDGLEAVPVRRIRAPFPTPNEYARAFWEQTVVPLEVARLRPDVYHSPNYILPAMLRCPSVVTVHDTAFLDRSVHRLRSHLYLTVLTTLALRKATRVVCVSEYTREALVRSFHYVADKCVVIGEGVAARFSPPPPDAVGTFRSHHGLTHPYVLFVGTIEPRKNLPRLLRAFAEAVRSGVPHDLVIAGASGWRAGPLHEAYRRSPVRDRVRFLGYVPDEDLPAAYGGADVVAYPSLHEGFGLPPLEAMACGTPVLTSNVSSLPEVVGGAALVVNPRDEGEIARALATLLCDSEMRARLSIAGLVRASEFRWDDVARRMIALYEDAAR